MYKFLLTDKILSDDNIFIREIESLEQLRIETDHKKLLTFLDDLRDDLKTKCEKDVMESRRKKILGYVFSEPD